MVVTLSLCNSNSGIAKFFSLSSHEQILANSTNLSDFVVADGCAGNFDRTGNSENAEWREELIGVEKHKISV